MSRPSPFLKLFRRYYNLENLSLPKTSHQSPFLRPQCLRTPHRVRPSHSHSPRTSSTTVLHLLRTAHHGPSPLDPNFVSILDAPPRLVRAGQRHGPGLIILALIPITAFCLGCWQVQRLGWKTDLIARFEDRLTFPPLELPLRIDENAVEAFDYRRVWAKGVLRHDQEMLVGPRLLDGEDGFNVVTPLERRDARGGVHKILCSRGWISKETAPQWFRKREGALPEGEVEVEGLLRMPPRKNMFTPKNEPDEGKWYFPDVKEMAEWTGSQPVWIEETMVPDLLTNYERTPKGVPIGRAATVNLKNNHTQYIFTWYALSIATSVMFWMVVKKPMSSVQRRVRHSVDWS